MHRQDCRIGSEASDARDGAGVRGRGSRSKHPRRRLLHAHEYVAPPDFERAEPTIRRILRDSVGGPLDRRCGSRLVLADDDSHAGEHDDLVFAVALPCWRGEHPRPVVRFY
jgi:hypothetical protein